MSRRLLLFLLGSTVAPVTGAQTPDQAAAPPTFAREVAPLLHRHCAECHRPDGVGPFSLLTYPEVRRRARQIGEVVASGFMPPWPPAAAHGPALRGDRRLPAADRATLLAWIEAGAPSGDLSFAPPPPAPADDWKLGPPDRVLSLTHPFIVPATGRDLYHNFVLPLGNDRPLRVRAVEFRPGSTLVVHHATVLVDTTRTSARRAAAAPGPAPGYPGMDLGDAYNPGGHFIGWTPGQAPYEAYPGTVWEIPPHADLVLQVHLLPTGRPERLTPEIGLHWSDAPPVAATAVVQLRARDIDIPPGAAAYVREERFTLPVGAAVLGLYPHAHYLGRDLQLFADLPDGERRWLLRIPDWDFNWQRDYRYVAPLSLPAGSEVVMRYVYDNSAGNPRNPASPPVRVQGGWNSTDEMGEVAVQLLLQDPADLAPLQAAQLRYEAQAAGGAARFLYQLGTDAARSGLTTKARDAFDAALRADPDFAPAHNALGSLAEDAGDLAAAETAYLAAARAAPAEPGFALNLARVLGWRGKVPASRAVLAAVVAQHPPHLTARLALARALTETGATDQARRVLEEGAAHHPDEPTLRLRLGQVLLVTGETAAAGSHLERALAAAQDPALRADAAFSLALLARAAGDLAATRSHLAEALAANPRHAGALLIGLDQAVDDGEPELATQRAHALRALPAEIRPPPEAIAAQLQSAAARAIWQHSAP